MHSPTDTGFACAVLVLTVAACDDPSVDLEPAGDPVDIRVDRSALDYLYRDRDGQIRSAPSLSEIPPQLRGAVMVHHPDIRTDDTPADTIYVANLLDTAPGDRVPARPSTREQYARHTADLRDARRLARWTAFAAEEFAKLDPRSVRQTASEQAQRKFDEFAERPSDPYTGRPDRSPDTGTVERDEPSPDDSTTD
jgi:hypothetical protein